MTYRIAIVGSRTFPTRRARELAFAFVAASATDASVCSGGAIGPDTEGRRAAQFYRREFYAHLPDWETYGKSAGFRRNVMIEADSDECIALWDGKSRGTKHTIDLFTRSKKPVVICGPHFPLACATKAEVFLCGKLQS
jgi:hypothetical protein